MNVKRIGRLAVCLLLVCCLIVNISPVRGCATSAGLAGSIAGVTAVNVPAGLVYGAAAIALGVMAGTNDDFQNLVGSAVSAGSEWIVDGCVELLRVVDEAGTAMYYAAGDFLESLRQGLFDEGVLVNNYISLGTSWPFTWGNDSYSVDSLSGSFRVIAVSASLNGAATSYYLYAVSPESFRFSYSKSGGSMFEYSASAVGSVYLYPFLSGGAHRILTGVPIFDLGAVSSTSEINSFVSGIDFDSPSISTPYDLSLGQISTVPIDGSSALDWAPEYQANRLKVIEGGNDPDPDSDPENDGKWFWPLALTLTTAELLLLSQADEWNGNTPPEFTDYTTSTEYEILSQPETDGYRGVEISPITSPLPGTGTNPDTGSDSDSNSGIDYTSWFQRIVELIEEFLDRFKTWVTDCKTAIEELPSKFADWFDKIIETLGDIWEWCKTLVSLLIDALKQLLVDLFAPSADFITNKVEALTAKYPYLDTFLALGADLKAYFLSLGTKPPIIYIDLGASDGLINWGDERFPFLDLTWYAAYKPTMDAVLGGFIWLWLAWRVFLSLPGIISGASGVWGSVLRHSERNSADSKEVSE